MKKTFMPFLTSYPIREILNNRKNIFLFFLFSFIKCYFDTNYQNRLPAHGKKYIRYRG